MPNSLDRPGGAGHGGAGRSRSSRGQRRLGSAIDLERRRPTRSKSSPGLHAWALALSPQWTPCGGGQCGQRHAHSYRHSHRSVVETICARQNPGDSFGAQPNALAFDKSGKKLFVCNGTQNAVAVVQFYPGESKLLGLIPVGWFPGAVAYDAKHESIYVANIKGLTSGRLRTSTGRPELTPCNGRARFRCAGARHPRTRGFHARSHSPTCAIRCWPSATSRAPWPSRAPCPGAGRRTQPL